MASDAYSVTVLARNVLSKVLCACGEDERLRSLATRVVMLLAVIEAAAVEVEHQHGVGSVKVLATLVKCQETLHDTASLVDSVFFLACTLMSSLYTGLTKASRAIQTQAALNVIEGRICRHFADFTALNIVATRSLVVARLSDVTPSLNASERGMLDALLDVRDIARRAGAELESVGASMNAAAAEVCRRAANLAAISATALNELSDALPPAVVAALVSAAAHRTHLVVMLNASLRRVGALLSEGAATMNAASACSDADAVLWHLLDRIAVDVNDALDNAVAATNTVICARESTVATIFDTAARAMPLLDSVHAVRVRDQFAAVATSLRADVRQPNDYFVAAILDSSPAPSITKMMSIMEAETVIPAHSMLLVLAVVAESDAALHDVLAVLSERLDQWRTAVSCIGESMSTYQSFKEDTDDTSADVYDDNEVQDAPTTDWMSATDDCATSPHAQCHAFITQKSVLLATSFSVMIDDIGAEVSCLHDVFTEKDDGHAALQADTFNAAATLCANVDNFEAQHSTGVVMLAEQQQQGLLGCAADDEYVTTLAKVKVAKRCILTPFLTSETGRGQSALPSNEALQATAASLPVPYAQLLPSAATMERITTEEMQLKVAAKAGETATVRMLILHGVDVNRVVGKSGRTAYQRAKRSAYFGGRWKIAALLRPVVDASERLRAAACSGDISTVRAVLLDDTVIASAIITTDKDSGMDALAYAVQYGDPEIIALIVAAQGQRKLNIVTTSAADDIPHVAAPPVGPKDFMLAVMRGDTETVCNMIVLWRCGHLVNNADNDVTALMFAAADGHDAMVTLLLTVPGINVNAKNSDGRTALMLAAWRGHSAVVSLLLAVPDIDVNDKDAHANTALSYAAWDGHVVVMSLLAAMPTIDVNVEALWVKNALKWAAKKKHVEVLKMQ